MSVLTSLLTWVREGNARRSASRSLHRLSAAELADLGIPTDRIYDVVDEMLLMNEHRRDCAVSASRAAVPARRGCLVSPARGASLTVPPL